MIRFKLTHFTLITLRRKNEEGEEEDDDEEEEEDEDEGEEESFNIRSRPKRSTAVKRGVCIH